MSAILTIRRFRLPNVSVIGSGQLHCARCGALDVDADGEVGLRLAAQSHRDQHFARHALVAIAGVTVGAVSMLAVRMIAESSVAQWATFAVAAVASSAAAHQYMPPVSPESSAGSPDVRQQL